MADRDRDYLDRGLERLERATSFVSAPLAALRRGSAQGDPRRVALVQAPLRRCAVGESRHAEQTFATGISLAIFVYFAARLGPQLCSWLS